MWDPLTSNHFLHQLQVNCSKRNCFPKENPYFHEYRAPLVSPLEAWFLLSFPIVLPKLGPSFMCIHNDIFVNPICRHVLFYLLSYASVWCPINNWWWGCSAREVSSSREGPRQKGSRPTRGLSLMWGASSSLGGSSSKRESTEQGIIPNGGRRPRQKVVAKYGPSVYGCRQRNPTRKWSDKQGN